MLRSQSRQRLGVAALARVRADVAKSRVLANAATANSSFAILGPHLGGEHAFDAIEV